MSPSRTRRRAVPKHRDRREVTTAVVTAAAVVLGTAVMIWLLRPGPPGTEGTGGIANRQPRAAWLVALTIAALLAFGWWALSRPRRRPSTTVVLIVGALVILLLAVLAGFLWPGGLLRHTEPLPEIDTGDVTSTTLPMELDATTVPGATTGTVSTEATVTPTTPTPAPAPGP
jgi:hypothetical protein